MRLALEFGQKLVLAVLELISQSMHANLGTQAGRTLLLRRTLSLTQRAQQSCTRLAR